MFPPQLEQVPPLRFPPASFQTSGLGVDRSPWVEWRKKGWSWSGGEPTSFQFRSPPGAAPLLADSASPSPRAFHLTHTSASASLLEFLSLLPLPLAHALSPLSPENSFLFPSKIQIKNQNQKNSSVLLLAHQARRRRRQGVVRARAGDQVSV